MATLEISERVILKRNFHQRFNHIQIYQVWKSVKFLPWNLSHHTLNNDNLFASFAKVHWGAGFTNVTDNFEMLKISLLTPAQTMIINGQFLSMLSVTTEITTTKTLTGTRLSNLPLLLWIFLLYEVLVIEVVLQQLQFVIHSWRFWTE